MKTLTFLSLIALLSIGSGQLDQATPSTLPAATDSAYAHANPGHIGAQIRTARLHRDMSTSTLAEAAGLTPLQLEKVERGYAVPTRDILLSIQLALDTELVLDAR